MPAQNSFEYAVIRVVPRVEREEFVNAGVILFSLQTRFLCARVKVDEARIRGLWPEADVETIRQHLDGLVKVSRGDSDGGPIAKLSLRERFHWLVSPRSTMIQISPVHSGLCESPEVALEQLFQKLV